MGISKLIGLKASLLFLAFVCLRNSGFTLLSLPLLHASLAALLVSIASHTAINLPLLLGKSSDGSFSLWSLLVFGPFLAFVRVFVFLRRRLSRDPAYTQIYPGLYVGGWPSSLDRLPPGDPAIIDCTCELPRNPSFISNAYMCVPTWDTRAPSPSDIELAIRWAGGKRSLKKPIFVHCAFGHGRSVAVMCALLVAFGIAEDWKHAEKIIREKRPCIRMNALHRETLDEWSKHRLSFKRNEVNVSSVIMSSARRN